MKNFNTLNPTDIYNFPKNWERFKFYNLFTINKEISTNIEKEVVLSLTKKGLVIRDLKSNKGQMASNYEKYTKVIPNDIVFNPMDLISGWVDIAYETGVVSPSYLSFRPIENKVNPLFVLFLFQSLYMNKMLFNFGKGVATLDGFGRWSINEDIILKTNIFLPDINIQNKIVKYLEQKTKKIDTLIEKLRKKIELLNEQRTSLIKQCITKGLDPNVEMKDSGVDWIGEIPRGWDLIKVKFLGDIRSGDGITNTELSDDGEIPVYGGNGIVGYYDEFNSSHTVIVIGRVGEKCGNIHLVYEKCWISDNSLILTLRDDTNYPWVSICLNSRDLNKIRNQSSQPLITSTQVKNESIPFPSENQRKQISNYLDQETLKIDQMVDTETKRIELLKEYRQSLISSVVTGKVLVTEDMI